MSRLLNPAAINSRRFFAATIDAFSLVLSLLEILGIVFSLSRVQMRGYFE
jgi:hypothetical protein